MQLLDAVLPQPASLLSVEQLQGPISSANDVKYGAGCCWLTACIWARVRIFSPDCITSSIHYLNYDDPSSIMQYARAHPISRSRPPMSYRIEVLKHQVAIPTVMTVTQLIV